jgi:uncharacterized protein YneF (UPF0154 family)
MDSIVIYPHVLVLNTAVILIDVVLIIGLVLGKVYISLRQDAIRLADASENC